MERGGGGGGGTRAQTELIKSSSPSVNKTSNETPNALQPTGLTETAGDEG